MKPDWLSTDFSPMELDLLQGAFFASRWDPVRFGRVSESPRQVTSSSVELSLFDCFTRSTDKVVGCSLGRPELTRRWIVLSGEARGAVEALWEAIHAEDVVVRKPTWFRDGVVEWAADKRWNASEQAQKVVPSFCHQRVEEYLSCLEASLGSGVACDDRFDATLP